MMAEVVFGHDLAWLLLPSARTFQSLEFKEYRFWSKSKSVVVFYELRVSPSQVTSWCEEIIEDQTINNLTAHLIWSCYLDTCNRIIISTYSVEFFYLHLNSIEVNTVTNQWAFTVLVKFSKFVTYTIN